LKLVLLHIHAGAAKGHSFHAQAESLLSGVLAA
jgi:hypothetical protein